MAEKTAISWTDSTFNPWIGCTKVGPGCDHCYAETLMDTRQGRVHWGAGNPRSHTSGANWKEPLRWNRQADEFFAEHSRRRRVFCASLADVFDNEVEPRWRADLFKLIRDTPNLDWLLLTKRISNAAKMLPWAMDGAPGGMIAGGMIWPNVWLGATVVNQEEADRDIPKLLATPARVRFLSIEPMLGPIDLTNVAPPNLGDGNEYHGFDVLTPHNRTIRPHIDWVIAGGESGPKARPAHPDWFRSLRDQCAAAGVAFLLKQWGEWAPGECASDLAMIRTERTATWWNDEWQFGSVTPRQSAEMHRDDEPDLYRIGKKAAGRLLDGVEHNAFPVPL